MFPPILVFGENLVLVIIVTRVVTGATCVTSVTIVTIITTSVTCVIIVTSVISGSRYESIGSCVRAVLAVLLEYWY